jgi:ATP-dependent DNA ligase
VEDLKRLHRGAGVMVLVGEYLNKSQKDFKGRPLAGFVIFDILVYNGKHLLGSTFQERQELLDTLFPFGNSFDRFMDNVSQNVYRAKNFTSDFESLWKEATKVQMYEGFVLKRPNGILENGFREANNTGWQLKIRKPTKNYKY